MHDLRRQIPRCLGFIVLALVCCLVAFSALLTLSYTIPSSAMQNNLNSSLATIEAEGEYPEAGGGGPSTRIDNFTTAFAFNISAHADGNPVHAAFANAFYADDALGETGALAAGLTQQPASDSAHYGSYARYWCGYVSVYKPLLCVMDFTQMRILFLGITLALLAWASWLIGKRIRPVAGLLFALAFLALNCFIPALSLAFDIPLALVGSIIVLLCLPRWKTRPVPWCVFFTVMGAMTTYLDWLTTPLITWGVPFAVLVLCLHCARQHLPLGKLFGAGAASLVCWLCGYGLLWLAKWVLSSLTCGRDVIADGLAQITVRTGSSIDTSALQASFNGLDAVSRNAQLVPGWVFPALACILIACGIACIVCRKRLRSFDGAACLAFAVTGILPYLWYLVAVNHSWVHYWFAYRSQLLTVLAAAFICYLLIEALATHSPRDVQTASKRP